MIKVDLVNFMGSDESVTDAARVSFSKRSDQYTPEQNIKLINYLAKHKHISPFGHAFASFRVKAPVFVARQLVKHRFLRWNETSRRYVDDEPEMFIPDKWRAKADSVKQGSGDGEILSLSDGLSREYSVQLCVEVVYEDAVYLYNRLINAGVAAEQARIVLPQAMMTEWVWSGSLDAFASMCKLRLDPHTQYESRLVAEEVSAHMAKLFPHSWKALLEHVS